LENPKKLYLVQVNMYLVHFSPGGEIPVEPGRGWLLVLSE